jgi:flagellar motor switch protein FliG
MPITNGEEKAAVLLSTLERPLAEAVLTKLKPDQSLRLRGRMQQVEASSQLSALQDEVLREFEEMSRVSNDSAPQLRLFNESGSGSPSLPNGKQAGPMALPVGSGAAPTSLAATQSSIILPPPPAVVMPATITPRADFPITDEDIEKDPNLCLKRLTTELLVQALHGEHARTVAMVISVLDGTRAGEVLRKLTPEIRKEASIRMSLSNAGDSEVQRRVIQATLRRARTLVIKPNEEASDAKVLKIANMIRLLSQADRAEILSMLDEQDADFSAKVKEQIYQFEDILRMENRSVQKLLAELDSKSLATAMKGADEEVREKIRGNLSKRAKESLDEEMEFLGQVGGATIKQAKKRVVEVIQKLDQNGDLAMMDKQDD